MGISTAQELVTRCQTELKDTSGVSWTDAFLIDALNAAQLAVVKKDYSAYTKIASLPLAAGIKQSIPSDGIAFVGLSYNMGTDGSTPGTAILEEDYDTYSQVLPSWPTATAKSVVKAVLRRPADRKTFYVYPPQPATGMGYAMQEYAARPPVIAVADIANSISLTDEYDNAIFYYMMARAHAKHDLRAENGLVTSFMLMFAAEFDGGSNG